MIAMTHATPKTAVTLTALRFPRDVGLLTDALVVVLLDPDVDEPERVPPSTFVGTTVFELLAAALKAAKVSLPLGFNANTIPA